MGDCETLRAAVTVSRRTVAPGTLGTAPVIQLRHALPRVDGPTLALARGQHVGRGRAGGERRLSGGLGPGRNRAAVCGACRHRAAVWGACRHPAAVWGACRHPAVVWGACRHRAARPTSAVHGWTEPRAARAVAPLVQLIHPTPTVDSVTGGTSPWTGGGGPCGGRIAAAILRVTAKLDTRLTAPLVQLRLAGPETNRAALPDGRGGAGRHDGGERGPRPAGGLKGRCGLQ